MGRVYEVAHARLGRSFAVKVLNPETSRTRAIRSQFFREAKLASSFSHPSLVSVLDYGDEGEHGPYMVMEFIEGRLLSEYIATNGRPSVKRACEIVQQIAEGLEHLHGRNVIHCDIKPQNIVLSEEPGERRRLVARILDFGLARTGASRPPDTVNGTPEYLPPEIATLSKPTAAADVYSLGVLFYWLLTGRVPFSGTVPEILTGHITGKIPALHELCEEEPNPALIALVNHALERDPQDRPRDMAAFLYELNNVMDMLGYGDRNRRRRNGARSELSPGTARPGSSTVDPAPPASETGGSLVQITFAAPAPRESSTASAPAGPGIDTLTLPLAIVSDEGIITAVNLCFAELLDAVEQELIGTALHQTRLALAWPDLEIDVATASAGVSTERDIDLAGSTGDVQRYRARFDTTLVGRELSLLLLPT
jgi:serine/threonine-protein kinase